jgi:hypothetical protein
MSKTRVAKINASAESVRGKSATEVAFAELVAYALRFFDAGEASLQHRPR